MVPYTAYRQSCYLEPVGDLLSIHVQLARPQLPFFRVAPYSPGVPVYALKAGQAMPPGPKGSVQESETLPPQNIQKSYNRSYPPSSKEPPLRMDRISSLGSTTAQLQGTVVRDDRITPRGGAKIFFASAEKSAPQYSASTDPTGRFSIELPAGKWTMYVTGNEGKPVYHSVISVKPKDQRLVTVVSR